MLGSTPIRFAVSTNGIVGGWSDTCHPAPSSRLHSGVLGYSRRVNQSGACSSSDVITRQKIRNNNGGQINRGCMWVPGAVRYYFILLQKQE